MKYTVVSSVEFTYPDIWDYASSSQVIDTFAARGSYATFQLLLGDRAAADVSVSITGLPAGADAEVYTLTPVQVERNHGISPEQMEKMKARREAMMKKLTPEQREKIKNMSKEERREFFKKLGGKKKGDAAKKEVKKEAVKKDKAAKKGKAAQKEVKKEAA